MTLQLPSASQSLQKEKKKFSKNHLITLLDGFCDFSGVEKSNLIFKGLSLNSKKVLEDYLFLACAGSSLNSGVRSDGDTKQQEQHGIAYAGDAINRGASCIVWEPTETLNSMPESCVVNGKPDVPLIPVKDLHAKVGEIAARFYEHPSRSVNMIGITGTNGKTSTAHFIAQLIYLMSEESEETGVQDKGCAVIGTLGNGLYGQLEKSTHTTPDAVTLQALIAQFCEQQANTIVMEVSSHALAQGRVNSIDFDTAVFTNLTRDHLDYHGDMKRYSEEKMKLFQYDSLKRIVVNIDDSFAADIIQQVKARQEGAKIYTCSRVDKGADYYAEDIKLDRKGISFNLCIKAKDSKQLRYPLNSHLVGDFNIDNLLAAVAVVHLQGYEISKIITAVAKIKTVPGRMEQIVIENMDNENLPLVVIDYAHTPDALEKGLIALRAHTEGSLTCIFGCGGDRDKGKRPLMAQIAEANADSIMVTSDNPRNESAQQIIRDIMVGFKQEQNVSSEVDRKKAINDVLGTSSKNDVIFIAGKGHEDYQEVNGQRIPFSDTECVLSFYSSRSQH